MQEVGLLFGPTQEGCTRPHTISQETRILLTFIEYLLSTRLCVKHVACCNLLAPKAILRKQHDVGTEQIQTGHLAAHNCTGSQRPTVPLLTRTQQGADLSQVKLSHPTTHQPEFSTCSPTPS